MMNEKELRELEYEREMQAQAEYMSRWKLRKEIKKKLRALRKKVKADEASLPQLKAISRNLDNIENPLEPCTMKNPEENSKKDSTLKIPLTARFIPMDTRIFKEKYAYNTSGIVAGEESKILETCLREMAESLGERLLAEGAIKYIIYPSDTIDKQWVEMTIMTVEER